MAAATRFVPPLLLLLALLVPPTARGQGPSVQADLALVTDGLAHPVSLAEPPDGTGRLFIADQTGQIWIVTEDGTRLPDPFLDLADRMVELEPAYDERGLLGLAFHPDYAANGRFFVYYSAPLRDEAPDEFDHTSHLSEFAVSGSDPDVADPESEVILLQVDQPQSNHNAGTLAFGPDDGYLYVSLGDGGGRDDQGVGHVDDWYKVNRNSGNGQDLEQNLLGSLLRLDVSAPGAYTVPVDNPFVGIEGVPPEQWAYGFRNPYRFSFDPGGAHDLIVGDAGQNLYEEVSVVTAGGNYGWNVYEGDHCFNAADPTNPFDDCPGVVGPGHPMEGAPLVGPVIELLNSSFFEDGDGLVVVGGHVYRGAELPAEFDGLYVFGMWSDGAAGRVLVAEPQASGPWPWAELDLGSPDSLEAFVLSFGQDGDGEVYVLTTEEVGPTGDTGRVYRLAAAGTVAVEGGPAGAPDAAHLEGSYPNPFRASTTIRYAVRQPGPVRLAVYDVLGREVVRLVDGDVGVGRHEAVLDGARLPSGVYLVRLEAGGSSRSVVQAQRITLVQ